MPRWSVLTMLYNCTQEVPQLHCKLRHHTKGSEPAMQVVHAMTGTLRLLRVPGLAVLLLACTLLSHAAAQVSHLIGKNSAHVRAYHQESGRIASGQIQLCGVLLCASVPACEFILRRPAFFYVPAWPPAHKVHGSTQTSADVEVLGLQYGPATTYYGEYRTYSATVVGVGVTGGFSGDIQFICGSTVIAQAPLTPLVGAQVPQVRTAGQLKCCLDWLL